MRKKGFMCPECGAVFNFFDSKTNRQEAEVCCIEHRTVGRLPINRAIPCTVIWKKEGQQ